MTEVKVPRDNVNDDSVTIRKIYFKSGDYVQKGQLVLEIETSKTSIEIEAPADGFISHELYAGIEIEVGNHLFVVGGLNQEIEELSPQFVVHSDKKNKKISNSAIKRAKELGIDIDQIDLDWVSSDDVNRHAGLLDKPITEVNNDIVKAREAVNLYATYKVERLSKRKQAEIKSLEEGRHQSTSSTISIDIEITNKRLIPAPFLFRDSISDLIVFEGSRLLRKYPELNSSFLDSKSWGSYEVVNFGWSFDDGKNLKVLAVKNSDNLSLIEVQDEVLRLLELYESNQNIPIELLTASTVTISDLSKTEASFILPLINGFQSLIIGITRKNTNSFSVYATFDHRVAEGFLVTQFLSELKTRIKSHFYDGKNFLELVCYGCEKKMKEEIQLGNRGFIKMMLPNGAEANFCRNCFDGL
jgi:pyruvate/2-oxoglutarate dehydrogenase complex dihydrolipoamide acyltransferase (E2) component